MNLPRLKASFFIQTRKKSIIIFIINFVITVIPLRLWHSSLEPKNTQIINSRFLWILINEPSWQNSLKQNWFLFLFVIFFSKKLQMRGDKEGELLFLPMRAFFRTIVPVMNENIFFSAEKRISLILSEWRVAVYQLDGWSNSLLLIGHS